MKIRSFTVLWAFFLDYAFTDEQFYFPPGEAVDGDEARNVSLIPQGTRKEAVQAACCTARAQVKSFLDLLQALNNYKTFTQSGHYPDLDRFRIGIRHVHTLKYNGAHTFSSYKNVFEMPSYYQDCVLLGGEEKDHGPYMPGCCSICLSHWKERQYHCQVPVQDSISGTRFYMRVEDVEAFLELPYHK